MSNDSEFGDAREIPVKNAERENVERLSTDVFRVGMRLPPFWPQEPAVWFAQVEGQFALSNITVDTTKYHYILSNLEHQYAAEVKDIIISPPATDKYEKLKSELIKRLSVSREKEVKQLLLHEELGDRKPSQFLRHLQHLGGPTVPDDFLKTIWSSRLPRNIQTVIASQPSSTLEALADLADRIQEIVPTTPQVASSSGFGPEKVWEQMVNQITELTKQVNALSTQVNRSRSRTRDNHQRGRSASRSQSNYRKYPVCWYHEKFGSKATKCMKPCDYKGNDQGGR